MERVPVKSSHFVSVGYDPAARKMQIAFKNGAIYEYANVPEQFHKTLMEADSSGEFFHKNVKPHFEARKVR